MVSFRVTGKVHQRVAKQHLKLDGYSSPKGVVLAQGVQKCSKTYMFSRVEEKCPRQVLARLAQKQKRHTPVVAKASKHENEQ